MSKPFLNECSLCKLHTFAEEHVLQRINAEESRYNLRSFDYLHYEKAR